MPNIIYFLCISIYLRLFRVFGRAVGRESRVLKRPYLVRPYSRTITHTHATCEKSSVQTWTWMGPFRGRELYMKKCAQKLVYRELWQIVGFFAWFLLCVYHISLILVFNSFAVTVFYFVFFMEANYRFCNCVKYNERQEMVLGTV